MKDLDKLAGIIKSCEIFSSLDYPACELIAHLFELVDIKQDDILFRINDVSNNFYILVQGELEAILIDDTTSEIKVIDKIYPSEPVGELGALSGSTRALTIRAVHNSTLLTMPSLEFKKLCYKYPSVVFEIMAPIIRRSQSAINLLGSEKKTQVVLVVSANQKTEMHDFSDMIKQNLEIYTDAVVLTNSDIISNDPIKVIENKSNQYGRVIICLESQYLNLIHECVKLSTSLYLVTNAESDDGIDKNILDLISNKHFPLKYELILLHSSNTKHPTHTASWLRKANFNLHHHLRLNNKSDFQRILRFMIGKVNCLVLGGGAGKGWMHVGVFKGLLEQGYPIDAVGGTSVGAVAGACLLAGDSYLEVHHLFSKLIEGAISATKMEELTWPIVSLMSAKHGTEALQHVFGEQRIEDLWIPYFCVSSNLSESALSIHREGFIWQAVRASVSLPGIIPPMVINGQLHMDGGLLNNLPVEIMRGLVGASSHIIAIKLSNHGVDQVTYDFPPIMTFKKGVFNKLSLAEKKYTIPLFFDTLLNAFLLGASSREKQNALLANVLINPDLSSFRQYEISKNQEDELVQLGYQQIMDYLLKSK